MSMSSTYKPSPLSFGSPRSSPFRRPESPASPSSTVRATTPTPSPTKAHTPITSPSKLYNSSTPTSHDGTWTPTALTPSITQREPPASPTRGTQTQVAHGGSMMMARGPNGDALARLPPAQVKEMREGFQILDRDSDGQVTRDDVVDMLTNLGQDSTSSAVSQFFPPGQQQTLSMPAFLNTLSNLLAPLSSQQEMLNAFAAFDDDDSGQIDVAELRDALLHTSPEAGERPLTEKEIEKAMASFTGRRAFGKGGGKRGEVFRYQEFVGSLVGGGNSSAEEATK